MLTANLRWMYPILVGLLALFVYLAVERRRAHAKLVATLRAEWGRVRPRERDLAAIARYHQAVVAKTGSAALDDRTANDLNLDAVFALLDRTESTIGQQGLYHRLRTTPSFDALAEFESYITFFSNDPAGRLRAQVALRRLSHATGYHLWWLTQPDTLVSQRWHIVFPIVASMTMAMLALSTVWPGALLGAAASAVVSLVLRTTVARDLQLVIGPFRQVGPLIAAAGMIGGLTISGAEEAQRAMADHARRLTRLRRIASWVGRETGGADLGSIAIEYLNMLLLLDANALFFGARELTARSGDLASLITAVASIDAALAVASYRAGTSGWTRPIFLPTGQAATLTDLCHPLVPDAVPNSIALGPPHGIIVTGTNMSGKSTFLRTVGVNALLAQTINTCLATRYEAPTFVIRSCLGRSDDLLSGKSYYIAEVEAVLALVAASATAVPHVFLFDELFRGTNAVERVAAGEAVLAELIAPHDDGPTKHVVIAATHDRELVELLGGTYASFHFADSVGTDGLTFSFRLEPGSATTRNAIALLKIKGAPARLIERALARAAAG